MGEKQRAIRLVKRVLITGKYLQSQPDGGRVLRLRVGGWHTRQRRRKRAAQTRSPRRRQVEGTELSPFMGATKGGAHRHALGEKSGSSLET